MTMTHAPKARPYSVLNALDPLAFLRPEDFRTEYDASQPEYAAGQYRKGREISDGSDCVFICANSTWAATWAQGVTTSSEGIGYHACTADLLRGFLDGDAPVRVHRYGDTPRNGVLVKLRTWSHHCRHCGEAVRRHGSPLDYVLVDKVGLSICGASGRKHEI